MGLMWLKKNLRTNVFKVFERSFSSQLGLVSILNKDRMADWPIAFVYTHLDLVLNSFDSIIRGGGNENTHQTIVWSFQALVPDQVDGEEVSHLRKEEVCYLGSSLLLLPRHGPSPYLSAYERICLTSSDIQWSP